MKGQTTNCKHCGQPFVKKKDKHYFCKTSHRVTYHQRQKGKSLKPFKTSIGEVVSIPQATKTRIVKPVKDFSQDKTFVQSVKKNYQSIQNTTPERTLLLNNRAYWEQVYNDTFQGKLPSLALVGAGTGWMLGKDSEDGAFGSIVGGALVGAIIQGLLPTPEQIRQNADIQIEKINRRLSELKVIESQVQNFVKVTDLYPKKLTGITSGKEYRNASIQTLGLTGKYVYLIGDPSPGFFMLLSGKSGNGKTTFAVEFAQHLETNNGKVLFMTYEQRGKNIPFQNLLNENAATFAISEYPPKTVEKFNDLVKGFNFVFIDSVNYAGLSASDIEEIRQKNPNLSIIGIMQNTKSGEFKGSSEFLHNCDVHVVARNGQAYQEKSRFAKGIADVAIWENNA
jgi:hypothetical protein